LRKAKCERGGVKPQRWSNGKSVPLRTIDASTSLMDCHPTPIAHYMRDRPAPSRGGWASELTALQLKMREIMRKRLDLFVAEGIGNVGHHGLGATDPRT
jgi:hypothetical protein